MGSTDLVGPVVAVIGAWSAGAGPLYAQLADAINRALDRGALPAGTRLPSERVLCEALCVSRTTVVAAYDILRANGSVQSHRGSGTRVAAREPAAEAAALDAGQELQPTILRRIAEPVATYGAEDLVDRGPFAFGAHGDDIELTIGALPGATVIAAEAERVAREDLPELLRSFGYLPYGLPALRAAVAAHMTDLGIPSVEDEILITSGAQQAIDLLSRHLGGPDTSVLIENPTYPPAIDVFRATGSRLVPLPLDDSGVRLDAFGQLAARRSGQIAYLNPICQNPTGTTLGPERAREVVRLAAVHGLTIIDDLTSAYLAFDGAPPPLGAIDSDARVITVGSLSKVAWGGLRIGWLRAPRGLVGQLAARKIDMDFSTSLFNQALAVRLFAQIDELAAAARLSARQRLDAVETALLDRLPDWRWSEPAGGLCLWIQLPAGDAGTFARVAAEHGAVVRPGPLFSADGGCTDRLRLAYGHEPEVLVEAVDRLAAAWAEYRPASARPVRRVVVTV